MLNAPQATQVARHVVEALFQAQNAERALGAARRALGPLHGVEELWAELELEAGRIRSLQLKIREASVTGRVTDIAKEHACATCVGPESTGERRGT